MALSWGDEIRLRDRLIGLPWISALLPLMAAEGRRLWSCSYGSVPAQPLSVAGWATGTADRQRTARDRHHDPGSSGGWLSVGV